MGKGSSGDISLVQSLGPGEAKGSATYLLKTSFVLTNNRNNKNCIVTNKKLETRIEP